VIDAGSIRQKHIGDRPPVFVLSEGLQPDFLSTAQEYRFYAKPA